jgi:hypothetical protein
MGTWTISTTAAEDDAITYSYQQSQRGNVLGGPPPPVQTVEEFFQDRTAHAAIGPMVTVHQQAKNTELLASFDTIPPENRPAATSDLEALVVQHGGTVKIRDATYLWSDLLVAPPPDKTVLMDVSQAEATPVTKLFFDDQDHAGVIQREGLLALGPNVLVRIEDPRQTAYFFAFVTTGAPVAGIGYVELPVRFHQSGGPLAAGWPMTCTFV